MTDHFADGKARNLVEKLVNKGRPRDHNRHIGGVNHLLKTFLFSAFQRFLVFIPSLSWQKDCILCIKAVSAPQAAQKTCCGSAKGSRPAERCLSFSSFPTLVPSLSWQMFSLKYKMRQEAVCDPHPERCLDRGSRERRRSGGGCL